LRLALENGFFPYPYFMTDPLLDVLRQEAEFTQLVEQAHRCHHAFSKSFFRSESSTDFQSKRCCG
jgi:hypothetical protein